ncbi:hypothetical protein [Methanosarcina sp. UBA411]|jgi:DNA-binding cell septation regulator SpoVG|uniref:hypothetical protein n=1 Tax=Methanosarcina sp. UBA411 TaxID=1915589 RepID=UPI0025D5026B|nr:hypothetical protein [Methanosarcina sp. UBA411]
MNENCYLLLELEFDPPVEDQAVIDQRIEEKRKFWSRNSTDFKKGAEYKKYLEMLPETKRIMSDPIERKKQSEAARNYVYAQLDKDLNILGRSGEITEEIIEKIATAKKLSADVVKKRVAALGIKIGQKKVDFDADNNKYYKKKPIKADTFDGMKNFLKPFNKDNFYDFLNPGTIPNMDKLPCDKLTQFAKEMKKDFNKNDANSSSGKKICEACELAFEDENSKMIYDEYLAWCKRRSILDHAKEIAQIAGLELSNEQGNVYIGQLTELFKDRKLAEKVLIAFCKVEKIAYNPNPLSENNENIKVCRCGCINDVSDGREVCQNCGNELIIKCPNPKCGAENDANIKVCKCGFKFENIDRALALCDLAQHAINTMDFEVANVHLKDAERYWPGSSKVKAIREQLEEFKQRIGDVAVNLRKTVQEKRYYEAKKQYAAIQRSFPEFKEADLELEITTSIETAQSYYNKARSASNENDIIENCTKASESCFDYPGVRELISRYPPHMPTDLRISPDGNTKTNILSWNESISHGTVYYSIVRKRDAIPVNNTDGDLVGRVNICSFNDSKILPGVFYYYAIFAERSGVYSKPLTSRTPAVNLFEITNVTVTTGDEMLQLDWDPIPSGSTVNLFRTAEDGKEEYVNSNNLAGYLDTGLKNDKVYNYRLCLVYNVNGQKQMTNGIKISGIPTRLPNAIETLSVKPVQDDTFQVTWENPENSEVRLYCSTDRPEYKCGEIVPQSILDSKMRRLAVTKTAYNSGTFQFKGDELLYITAVVIKSGSVVIGAIARAANKGTIIIKNIAVVNDKINIFINLPKRATGFVVLYRFDQYPIGINDRESIRKYITLKQYQHDNILIIDDLKPKNYYFSVFAEFNRDGEKDYSTGTDYPFVNAPKEVITYSISLAKKFFGFGENSVKINFEAENESFILPDIDIVSAVEHVPMFKASAKLFYSIPTQSVTGSLQVKIPFPKNTERETYIKAFLKNEALQSSYQLQLKVNSSFKIS